MKITVREYTASDIGAMVRIWNEVVAEGIAFPQLEELDPASGAAFFAQQDFSAVAVDESGEVVGLYILHPNNIGRCGHIGNASYAVRSDRRGLRIGEKLVAHCIEKARQAGFRLIQFNAVVATNVHARHLYERMGFQFLGTIPGGFHMKDGHFEDICLYYYVL